MDSETVNGLPDLSLFDTFPKLLQLHARNFPEEVALRVKDLGIWHSLTWAQYQAKVKGFALGLHHVGIRRGDVVGLIGDNRPDWVCGEIAAHAVGAMSLGMYRDALDEELAFLITYSGARAIFAEDEEQVDKLLALGDRIGSTTEPDPTAASRLGVLFELVTPDKRFAIAIEELHG